MAKHNALFNTLKANSITIALDGTGGDNRSTKNVVGAVRFALAMNPLIHLIVFGSTELQQDLARSGINQKSYTFRLAPQSIPQDESPRRVLSGYRHAAMRQAILSVKNGEADAVVSGGGTGPLVALSRHILGTIGSMRPALAAKIPAGVGRFSIMLDLGANASCKIEDMHDFAILGSAYAKVALNCDSPRVAILNVGIERNKGPSQIRSLRDLLDADRSLYFQGYVEANHLFSGDADVIVTDGFTGNVALKAAEGVASIFANGPGLKRYLAKMAWPDWLLPWQYNGSPLLGVNGIVVKSHASAGDEALAVAMVEAANAVSVDLASQMTSLSKRAK